MATVPPDKVNGKQKQQKVTTEREAHHFSFEEMSGASIAPIRDRES